MHRRLVPARTSPRSRRTQALAALRGAVLALSGACAVAAAGTATATPASQRWSLLTQTSFQHLTQNHGLPNEIASAITQDGDGFVWVGTLSGLARWDGYRFRIYKADPRTPGALPDNFIQTLHTDAAGRLWIGTNAAGLVRYDRSEDRFVTLPVGPQGLSHVGVRGIVDDGAGGLWVATDGGLDRVDPAGHIQRAQHDTAESPGRSGDRVNALLRDRAGRLWAGTRDGLFVREAGATRFVRMPLAPVLPRAGGQGWQPEPQSLIEDSGGRIWIGTAQHGAYVIEAGGHVAQPVQESSAPAAGTALALQPVAAITEARPGEVWLATVGQGIVAVDVATRQTRRIRHVPTLPLSLLDNAVIGLHRDRSGLVWVATNRGVSRHDPRQSAVTTMFGAPRCGREGSTDAAGPSNVEVSWILPTPQGRVWLGTHKNGVDIVDPTGACVASLRPDPERPETALPQAIVLALAQTEDGSVFIGTKRGLYRATADGAQVSHVDIPGRDPSAVTWALLAQGNTLWVSDAAGTVWQLDARTGTAVPRLGDPARPLTDERIFVLAAGDAGSLWIGTRHGLNRYDPASGAVARIVPDPTRPDGLSAGFVTSVFTDRQSRVWVGTYGGGINILEAGSPLDRPRFRHLSSAEGLPDDNVNALVQDGSGNVWVSTDSGLARVDLQTLAVRTLRRAEGVAFATYWTGSAAATPEGELLFGGAGGMTIVRPERLQTWGHRPAVVVTEIMIGGKSVPAGRYVGTSGAAPVGTADPQAAASAPPANTALLTVPPDANSLAVEFAAIDYSAPERNRYAYRLEGYDADWIDTDATRRLAAYTNLPPGDYRLMLRGSNRDGAWGDQVLSLPLRVLPAWYETWWFRGGAALAGLAAVLAIVQARTRFLRAQQVDLERKVRERTAELQDVSRALTEKSRVLELTSISDPLTGLRNRRFLTQHIDTEIGASLRRAQDSSAAGPAEPAQPVDTDNVFLLVDIDHFKRVNDAHGHAAGDAVLVQFAQRLQVVLRESDYLVRWGGEEFLAVARNTDRARAEELAERIRAVVADTPFILDDGLRLGISCSVGFACLPFIDAQPRALGWQDVVKLADLSLLAAKRVGRDGWVGMYATEAASPDDLVARVHAQPQQSVQRGEIRMVSNRAGGDVFEALAPPEPAPAWPQNVS